jgi:hypothetical protein
MKPLDVGHLVKHWMQVICHDQDRPTTSIDPQTSFLTASATLSRSFGNCIGQRQSKAVHNSYPDLLGPNQDLLLILSSRHVLLLVILSS